MSVSGGLLPASRRRAAPLGLRDATHKRAVCAVPMPQQQGQHVGTDDAFAIQVASQVSGEL